MKRTIYCNGRLLQEGQLMEQAVIVISNEQKEYQEPAPGAKPVKVTPALADTIVSVGTEMPEVTPEDTVIDLEGRFVIPGLIDADARLDTLNASSDDYVDNIGIPFRTFISLRSAAEALHTGVTTVKAVGMPNNIDIALKNAFTKTMFFGPSILVTGPIYGIHGGKGHEKYGMIECSGTDDFRAQVRIHVSRGVDGITFQVSGDPLASLKGEFYPEMAPSELIAMVKQVHGAEKKVAVNASGVPSIAMALEAGVDIIQQGYRISKEQLREMADRGIWYVPCLVSTLGTEFEAMHQQTVRDAIELGVTIAVGTEILPSEPVDGTTAYIKEMELLAACGMAPEAVLEAATCGAAACIGCKAGVVKAGTPADFVVLAGDPREDMAALRQQMMVVHSGRPVFDFIGDEPRVCFSADGTELLMGGGASIDWAADALTSVKEPQNYNTTWNLIKEI